MKEGEVFQNREADTQETMSDRELAGYLSGCGNNESKALLIASMKLGKVYPSFQLQDLLIAPQHKSGGREVWKISGNVVRDLCRKSIIPNGLLEENNKYGVSLNSGRADRAIALSGHLLAFSEEHDITLMSFFWRTTRNAMSLETSADGVLTSAPPSPLTRYRIFKIF